MIHAAYYMWNVISFYITAKLKPQDMLVNRPPDGPLTPRLWGDIECKLHCVTHQTEYETFSGLAAAIFETYSEHPLSWAEVP